MSKLECINKLTAVLAAALLLGTIAIFPMQSVYAESSKEQNSGNGWEHAHKAKHTPIEIVSKHNKIFYDFDNDGLNDYYFKIHRTGSGERQFMVDIKVRDTCVDGVTHDQAKMKLGFTNPEIDYLKREWLTDFYVSNSWFESGKGVDSNNRIDLVDLPPGTLPIPFPQTGDDLIQKSPENNNGSFKYRNKIKELGNQDGWEGSIFFNGPQGDYFMWAVFPADGSPSGEACDIVAALGVGINI